MSVFKSDERRSRRRTLIGRRETSKTANRTVGVGHEIVRCELDDLLNVKARLYFQQEHYIDRCYVIVHRCTVNS